MSFIMYDSSIAKEKASSSLLTCTNVKANNASSIEIFNQSLPDADEKKDNNQDSVERQEEINRNFDIDEMYKKYKKEPSKILDELNINFSESQRKELESIIKDKKSLKSFLNTVKQDKLNVDDIFASMKKTAEKKTSGFFKRIGNFFDTLVHEGLSEAIDLAKSEKVYYSEKLSSGMNEIRGEREDFSSEGVANIAEAIIEEPEIKESTMHFVTKEESAGKKLYTETDVTKVVTILEEKPEDAQEFTANAAELEAIKDSNGSIKYQGSTIINVDEKMINNKELQSTMMNAAKKKDMDDNYIIGITDNLVENPKMQEALDKLLKLKDGEGNDRFSAGNIFDQSDYMKDKTLKAINIYFDNTEELSQHGKLSGDNIVTIASAVTDNPSIKDNVYNLIKNQDKSGDYVEKYVSETTSSTNNAKSYTSSSMNLQNKETATNPVSYADESPFVKYQKLADKLLTNEAGEKDKTQNTEENYVQKTTISGKTYERSAVLYELYRKYGTSAEKILQKLEKDAKFIDVIKRYGNQKVILESIAENPVLVNKLLRSSAGISTSDLAEMIPLCTNSAVTEALIKLTVKYGPAKAVSMITQGKNSNTLDQIMYILDNGTMDTTTQKEKIENLNNKNVKQGQSIFN